ncbi:MAG: VWA domain-containing protein [Candidatus Omnitrophica bacterium]|nr:VWA domain-containing protein [Candidatus Omnitrophota bacterium]
MSFHSPLFLLLILPTLILCLLDWRKGYAGGLRFSSAEMLKCHRVSWKLAARRLLLLFRPAALVLIILAFARPQSPVEDSRVESEGIDIVLAIDASTSMLAEDFSTGNRRRNRLFAVKQVVKEFIEGRRNDRIGIVAFAGRAYVVSPLTLDYGWLMQNLERVEAGMMEDGTAVGSGLTASLNRLKDTRAQSKVVILLTDGRNNAGKISPLTAAGAAKALGIKVYTIGAGSRGPVPYPRNFFGRVIYESIELDLDEETLQEIAELSGGQYFRATDTRSLRSIYRQIDEMETTVIEEQGFQEHEELFLLFLLPGLVLLVLEAVLSETLLRKIP